MRPITIWSRAMAQTSKLAYPYIHIAISDPSAPDIADNGDPNKVAVLRVKFHDILPHQIGENEEWILMGSDHAEEIVRFVRQHEGVDIAVNCEVGVSRSAGVAAALCAILGLDDDHVYRNHNPNVHCKSLVLSAARRGS